MNTSLEKVGLFSRFIETLFWIKTFLSPSLGGMFIGLIFLYTIDTPIGVSLFWVCTALGIIAGIVLATRISMKQENAEYHKEVMASPDMDVFDE